MPYERPAPVVEPGTRLAIAGRAGTGKTYIAKWFMLRAGQRYVVLDTKYDSGLRDWKGHKRLPTMAQLAADWRERKITVARPTPRELKPAILDAWLEELHESFDNFGAYVDELYSVCPPQHPPGPGLTGLITRGRDRKQSVMAGAQRPSLVPLFVYSEANAFAATDLLLPQDRKRLYDVTGREEFFDRVADRHWRYFDVAARTLTRYGPVRIV